MKRLTAVMTTLTMLAVGLIFRVPVAHADSSSWQRSVMIQPTSSTDFASASFDQSVKNAVNDGANYIVLIIPVHQSNIYSTDVATGNDTPTDQSLTSAVSYIHSLGAHAVFNIHDDPYDGQWRALINPSDRTTWFNNYGALLRHYGSLAKTDGTEEMVLGTELSHMTDPTLNSTNTANWDSMIASVRLVYGGKLTYSAQHDGYLSDLQNIGFWDRLDYIGVSAYYGMGNDTSVSAITSQWQLIDQNNLAPLAAKYGKQILFTEIGYASKAGSLSDPGTAYQQGGGYDPTLQANAYSALFSYWGASNHFAGVAWWDWKSDPNAGGNGNTDYTPQNKPAEAIMKQGFNGGGMGGGASTGGNGVTTSPAVPGPVAGTTYTTSASASGSPTVNSPVTVTGNASASTPTSNVLVDVEVYDASGKQVAQKYYDNQTLTTSPTPYSFSWTPAAAGTYTIKMGVFNSNWQGNLSWNGNAGAITVSSQATSGSTTTPPSTGSGNTTPTQPGSGTTTPPASGGSSTTTAPSQPSSANISIWWPGSTQPVSGVQPFKALIDGRSLSTYTMYWQVDGGTLNVMSDNQNGGAHKESSVDLSSWNWQPTGKYTINFVAKDLSGNVIAQKSVVITVTH